MEKTKLSEHEKIGDTLHTPFTSNFGDGLQLTSWSKDRLPEYMWIALILNHYGRNEGLRIMYQIMQRLKENDSCIAELSKILELDDEMQEQIYSTIDLFVPKEVLSLLTVVLSSASYPCFFNHYCLPEKSVEEKIDALYSVIKKTSTFHSNETTDVCFIINWFYVVSGRLHLRKGLDLISDALCEYHKHSHEDEIMCAYRPSIRSTAQGLGMMQSTEFPALFWNRLAEITACNPLIISFSKGGEMDTTYYEDVHKLIEYIAATTRDKIQSAKYSVVMGITVYTIKLYSEIVNNALGNAVSGRIVFRSMLEAYINLKYLLLKESEQPDVFEMFQNYGIGKYKLVMAKLREGKYSISDVSHINPRILELYVNESKDEIYQEISLGYFDKDSIKKKAELVGEQELYEIFYEYNTNYSHAFWGAIRESSMLICDNPAHLYHAVPDFTFEQTLLDLNADCIMVLQKLVRSISSYIELPDFYIDKYEVGNV
jgi:hypothetical protein